ncbi:MAG: HlyD family secretion protein [Planctomycetota bacterium]
MSEGGRIRTPLARWGQMLVRRVVPVAAWLGAVALAVTLWREQTARVDTPGILEARQAAVASVQGGSVASLPVALFDEVAAGQVVVRLKDDAVRAELAVAQAEVSRLEAELRAAERQLNEDQALRELDLFAQSRTYAMRIERLRMDKLDHRIELENDRVQLQRLAASVERLRALRASQIVGDQEYDDLRYEHDALAKKIAATEEALEVIERQLREATAREEAPGFTEAVEPVTVALAPLREAVSVQLRRVDEIQVAREALVLRSPIDGVVATVNHGPGEAVMPGAPILTVADPGTLRVVSFVEQSKNLAPSEGMVVEVRRRTRPVQVARARVAKVGAQMELMPPAVCGGVAVQRWGLRVLIDLPPSLLAHGTGPGDGTFAPPRPGEVVGVRYFVSRRPQWSSPRETEEGGGGAGGEAARPG